MERSRESAGFIAKNPPKLPVEAGGPASTCGLAVEMTGLQTGGEAPGKKLWSEEFEKGSTLQSGPLLLFNELLMSSWCHRAKGRTQSRFLGTHTFFTHRIMFSAPLPAVL